VLYNYFSLIAFLAGFSVGVFVYIKNPKKEINIVLSLLILVVSIWTLILFISKFAYAQETIFMLMRLNFSVMTFGPLLFLVFVEIFPNYPVKENKYLFYYALPIPLLLLSVFSPYFVINVSNVNGNIELKRGILHLVWSGYFVIYVVIALSRLLSKYRRSKSLIKLQIQYVFAGFYLMILCGSITNIVLPLFKINSFIHYGPLFTLPFIALLSYSILKHRLLDIAIFIKKSLVYFVLVTFISTVYILMFLLTRSVFSNAHISVSIFVSLLSAVLIAVTMDPLKDLIGRWTDKIFFKGKYDYYKVLKTLIQTLNSVVKVDEVLTKVIDTITEAMRLEYTAIFILERNTNTFTANRTSKDGLTWAGSIEQEDPLVAYISEKKDALVYDELGYLITDKDRSAVVKDSFIRLKAKVFIPIILKEKLIGLLVLGGKKSDDIFTQEDLDLLNMIAHQISVVLENTNLYEQMLNTAKLALVGTMAAGMAHEIRNPLTSMKTFIQLLPDKHTDKEFVERFNAVVGEEINRLDRLTEDLLSFAKPKLHRYEQIDVNYFVEKVIELFEMQTGKKKIQITKLLKNVPKVYADEEQLTQVFMNMFLNSMQALEAKKSITIETGIDIGENLQKLVTISINDTGSGIPDHILERIFDPFFTTKKEGTGLGLAICLKIIQEHNGFIKVKSRVNEGTSFKIFLPAYDPR